ncbi:atherin-like isoform X1 [Thrips palmi]|uniref:Atherin-like isoform X1 n=1 Tax=Thrips palmi TaxID=161013 RepID=A0A6P8ZQW4_THRPL|nr:atherin-like isoform X1 [Thrips palmi]XP_034246555.1 atherin-like isoform X1 [Thrips palmi]XP_034246556.1 atherin-like isoform X1 [Thrips palmi]XP_034246558.1 atherin-like isoform X1 [Thrips palmi]XP_034246559.1 atherin-like isoform X1 [Thrips palmi]
MTSSVATMMPPRTRCLVTVRTYAERERFMQRRQQLEQQHAAQVSAGLALSAARERGLRVERDRQDSQEAEREVTRLVRRNGPRHPPPPLPAPPAAQADGEASAKETPAPPAMPPPAPATPAAPACVAPPPPAFTTVTLTGRTSPKPAPKAAPKVNHKVVAKPPLPSNGAVVNGAVKSAGVNGLGNGTASANGGQTSSNGLIAIQQSRLKPVHHHLLQQQAQPQHQLRVNHRTPSPAPYCPTPDYDSDSSGSTMHTASTAWTVRAAGDEAATATATTAATGAVAFVPEVEMQSLDSLELLEPRARQPRPPQTYFQQNRAPAAPRPAVCVTIREYGAAASRQPSKLTFLNGQQQQQDEASGLQDELAATLSRSNLRTRTDVVDAGSDGHAKEASKALDEVSRGNVTVTSVNGGAPKNGVPNGILKKASVTHMAAGPVGHGLTPAILAGAGAALKPKSSGVATKTISFGAKATIINEKQIST